MTRRRWIADEISGNRAALTGEHAHHLAQVLRAKVGQEFEIATGDDVRAGKVIGVDNNRVEFELGDVLATSAHAEISVAISIFKFDRMEWAIEKCTELGVAGIIPVVAGRTEPHLAKAAEKRVERWRRIAQQASEQSRRSTPPNFSQPIRFKEFVSMQSDAKIVLSEIENGLMLKDAIQSGPTLLAFGPEGGWKQDELGAFRENGWRSASLGNTILRAETAVIAAVAVVMSCLES